MPEQRDAFGSEVTNEAMKKAFEDVAKVKTPASQPTLTFGQQLVGINFNPANDDKVGKAKQLCADLMDLVNSERANKETSHLESILYNHTVGEILNAQMNVVKLLTLKY